MAGAGIAPEPPNIGVEEGNDAVEAVVEPRFPDENIEPDELVKGLAIV